MMTISQPIVEEIEDTEAALERFERNVFSEKSEKVREIIVNFPTVYIHNWPEQDKYEV